MITAKAAAIEISPEEVRVAVVKTGSANPVVLELKSCPIEAVDSEFFSEAASSALSQVVDELSYQPSTWTLCLNADQAIIRPISIPFKGRRRVGSAVQFELEPYLAFPIEELLVDHLITSEVDGETDVLAVGIRRNIAEEQLQILEQAGIGADSITLDAVALAGLWSTTQKKGKSIQAQIFVRDQTVCLTICQGKSLLYIRNLPWTQEQLESSPQQVLRDLQHTFRAFTTTWRGTGEIEQLNILGVVLDQEVEASLSNDLPFPVSSSLLIPQIKGGGLAPTARPGSDKLNIWEATVGAAYGAGGNCASIDFNHNERDPRVAINRGITHVLFSACLMLVLLLGFALYFHFSTSKYKHAMQLIQREKDTLTQELDELSTKIHDVDTALFSDPTVLDLLKDIAQAMPENKVTINQIKLEPRRARGKWITIEGTATSSAQFNAVFNNLQKSTLMTPDDPPEMRVDGQITTFKIRAQRYEAPATALEE